MANVGVTFNFAAESARLRADIDRVRKEMMSLKATGADGFKEMSEKYEELGSSLYLKSN